MTLLGNRKAKLDQALTARGAILSGQLDVLINEIHNQTVLLSDILRGQREVVAASKEVLASNKEFTEVIRHFFAVEHNVKLEEAKAKKLKEAEFEETAADKKY